MPLQQLTPQGKLGVQAWDLKVWQLNPGCLQQLCTLKLCGKQLHVLPSHLLLGNFSKCHLLFLLSFL